MSAQLATPPSPPSPPSPMSAAAPIDVLWLDTLHRLCARAAHELKGALNGVSVNLEVVRSRAAKPDTAAASVARYANAAVAQFDEVMELSAALLSLARQARVPVELGPTIRDIAVPLQRAAKSDGRRLELASAFDELGVTSAQGNAARLAIGASLLAGIESSAHVECRALPNATLRIGSCDGAALRPPSAAVIDAVADAGIRIEAESSAISIRFPR